ncbi:LemA family protein [Patescibacteria group bacterium]
MSLFVGLLIVLGALVVYALTIYNKFVTSKTRIKASIQEIGNQLKRQSGLIPNLVQSVKGYMKHEKSIFTEITQARKGVTSALKSGNVQKMIDAGNKLQTALSPINAIFESTPELKAAQPTVKMMDELRDTADKIMYSRRTLIDLTADYNVMVETVPSKFIAMIFGFKQEPGLKMPKDGQHIEVSEAETKNPKVKL